MSKLSTAGRPLNDAKFLAGHLYLIYEDDFGNKSILTANPTKFGRGIIDVDDKNQSAWVKFFDSREFNIDQSNTDIVDIDLGNQSIEGIEFLIDQYALAIDKEHLKYLPNTQNSNSVIASVLDLVGIDVDDFLPNPAGVQAFDFAGKSNILEFDYQIQGSFVNDYMQGRDGEQTFQGGLGNDQLFGGDDTDYLSGGFDQDDLYGEKGNDFLYGESGNDDLYGGIGKDFLNGGFGIDILDGGHGNDSLIGGGHTDIFRFDGNFGNDTIFDFKNDDYIDVVGASEIEIQIAINSASMKKQDVKIPFDDGSITLVGLDIEDLNLDMFGFFSNPPVLV